MLWGTQLQVLVAGASRRTSTATARVEFGEALPDAKVFKACGRRVRALRGQARSLWSRAWKPTGVGRLHGRRRDGATMSEYFGQWKVSRFVLGEKCEGRLVQRRLEAVRHRRHPRRPARHLRGHPAGDREGRRAAGGADEARARQPLEFARLRKQEGRGKRFTPEQADSLGRTAQERATAIAGQVTQAAARLKVKIAQ